MRRIILCFLIIAALFSCAAAETDVNTLETYDMIDMHDTRDALIGKLGEGEELDKYLRFSSALCAFFDSGALRAKLIWFDDPASIASAVATNLDAAKKLKQGASMQDVVNAFGCEGVEIMRINLSDEPDSAQQIVYLWCDESARVIEALFEYEEGTLRLFAAVENDPEA